MREEREWGFQITSIAILDEDIVGKYIEGIPVIANKDNLFDVVTKSVVDEVFISLPRKIQINITETILKFENIGITVNLGISTFNLNINAKTIKNFGGFNVLSFSTKGFDKSYMILKRPIDIVGAIIGLGLTLIISIFIAPAILIESPGPLIFSQVRIGKNGRRFKIYKFRSMYADAEARKKELLSKNEMQGFMFKMENDPRITKVGRFIRKTSIDELPQFFNVLKGDMSLVGTRPPTEDEFLQYKGRHKRRLSLKPGITGLWQVSGRSEIVDFEDVVRLDREYIDHWSLLQDIKLLFKTVFVVVFRVGAK
jgi:exopolysaccharide biosynthesis polyprenyl glycosylphosphotransferase